MASRFPIDPTRESILKFVTEVQIFEYYLGTIVDLDKSYCSPLRTDKNPTCTFKIIRSGRLWFRDWAGHFKGDCFNLVESYYNCDFKTALYHIDRDLNLNLFDISLSISRKSIKDETTKIDMTIKERAVIGVVRQKYQFHDLKYWASQGVIPEYLNEYEVFVGKVIKINGHTVWTYINSNPIYVSIVPSGAIKCYRPLEKDKSRKWLSNTSSDDIFGWKQLPETGDLCFITKSLKDVMALKYLGYTSCAVQAEGNKFPKDKMEKLLRRFKVVIFLYDNDEAGMKSMKEEAERFNVPYTYIPQFIDGKDVSGLINLYGATYTKDIIEININNYK